MKKLLIVFALALLAACAQPAEQPKEIPIGVLVDLSGPLTTFGTNIKNTLVVAEEDINSYLKGKGLPYRVKFYYEDTKVDPKVALEKVQALDAKGVKIFIGPMASGEVRGIMGYVNANKLIIVSPSSTALPHLLGATKPEDKTYIFRFVATDDFQTRAIASEIESLEIKAVAIIHIGNAWGRGLCEAIEPLLKEKKVEILTKVEYPSPPPADFSPYIAELERAISGNYEKFRGKIAIVAFSYEEVATILAQTKADSILLNVLWIGCDGTAKSAKVVGEVCDKASKVKLFSTLFESYGRGLENLTKKMREKGIKDDPYQYALNAYDAAWVLTLSYIEVVREKGKYDADLMAKKIIDVTKKYSAGEYGIKTVSGFIQLNVWNDRASGDFAIFQVTPKCTWEKVGVWKFETGKIEWK
ncbi:MAG: ABC transporter substrate-binding protein [Archaeoglobaceae archaeon]|nr:ABC transporter substrate-binding protein [Archaeoglobaceae archaeon]MCX8151572.1 ABC transporter substrate-binding protein [Archaeoglobaceae archaeon]MDW8013150.1 ABC transporter substrate-binding protein [Archaeoglobaceae archaeon]